MKRILFLALIFTACERTEIEPTYTVEITQPTLSERLEIQNAAAHFGELYGVPYEVIVGVATNESGLGSYKLAKESNNAFGIRAYNNWHGERCGKWRKYDSLAESVEDFCAFVTLHYPALIGQPSEEWQMYGYGSSKYEKSNFWQQFKN